LSTDYTCLDGMLIQMQASGHRKVEIVSNDQRILMECDDLHEFVIYSVDANQFVKASLKFESGCYSMLGA
jgi:hypothetical protein